VVDFFGGGGTAFHALAAAGVRIASYRLVEIDPVKIRIASHYTSLVQSKYPGLLMPGALDHMFSLPQDVRLVTPELLASLGPVDFFSAAWPCQGLSQANPSGKGLEDARSGLFFAAYSALLELRKINPDIRYLFENVAFDEQRGRTGVKRREELRQILELLQPPFFAKFDAALLGPAKRRRMYLSNLPGACVPEARQDRDWSTVLDDDHEPPISILTDDGIRYAAFNIEGEMARKAPTVMARWWDTWSLRDGTSLLRNLITGEREMPRIHELEQMVGLLVGATAAPGVSEADRRKACGDILDRHVFTHLVSGLAAQSWEPVQPAKSDIELDPPRKYFTSQDVAQLRRLADEIDQFHPREGLAVGPISSQSENAADIKEFIRTRTYLDLSEEGGFLSSADADACLLWGRFTLVRSRVGGDEKAPLCIIASPDGVRRNLVLRIPPRPAGVTPEQQMRHAFRQATWADNTEGLHIPGIRINAGEFRRLGTPEDLVQLLLKGERFLLEGYPLEYWGRNYLSIQENLDATSKDLDRLIASGWLEGPLHYRPWLVTPLGAVVKTDKFRLVVDCTKTWLNSFMVKVECKLDSLEDYIADIPRGAWLSKFDMADAFFHWGVEQSHSDLLGIQHPVTGQYYRYRYCPFGASQPPAIQQRWAVEVRRLINLHGLKYCEPGSPESDYSTFHCSAAYLDDFGQWHCPSLSKEQADRQFDSVKRVLADLGVEAKAKKDIRPAKEIEYVGFLINSATEEVSLTLSRRAKITGHIDSLLSLLHGDSSLPPPAGPAVPLSPRLVSRLSVARITGELQFCAKLVEDGQHQLEPLYSARDSFASPETAHLDMISQWKPDIQITFNSEAESSLLRWRGLLQRDVKRALRLKESKDSAEPGQFLSDELPFPESDAATDDSLIPRGTLFFDGASRGNPGPASSGAAILDKNGVELSAHSEYLGICSNNVAEYRALIAGISDALALGMKHLDIRGDSLLARNQVVGLWSTKERILIPLRNEARRLLKLLGSYTFAHVPRSLNARADALANHALDDPANAIERNFDAISLWKGAPAFEFTSSFAGTPGCIIPAKPRRSAPWGLLPPQHELNVDLSGKLSFLQPDERLISEQLEELLSARERSPFHTAAALLLPVPSGRMNLWWKRLSGMKLLAFWSDITPAIGLAQVSKHPRQHVLAYLPFVSDRRNLDTSKVGGSASRSLNSAILPTLSGNLQADLSLLRQMPEGCMLGLRRSEHATDHQPNPVRALPLTRPSGPQSPLHQPDSGAREEGENHSPVLRSDLSRGPEIAGKHAQKPSNRGESLPQLRDGTESAGIPLSPRGPCGILKLRSAHSSDGRGDSCGLSRRSGCVASASHVSWAHRDQSVRTYNGKRGEAYNFIELQKSVSGKEPNNYCPVEGNASCRPTNLSSRLSHSVDNNVYCSRLHQDRRSECHRSALLDREWQGYLSARFSHQNHEMPHAGNALSACAGQGRQESQPEYADERSLSPGIHFRAQSLSYPGGDELPTESPACKHEQISVSSATSQRKSLEFVQTEQIRSHSGSQAKCSAQGGNLESLPIHEQGRAEGVWYHKLEEMSGANHNQRWMADPRTNGHGRLGKEQTIHRCISDHSALYTSHDTSASWPEAGTDLLRSCISNGNSGGQTGDCKLLQHRPSQQTSTSSQSAKTTEEHHQVPKNRSTAANKSQLGSFIPFVKNKIEKSSGQYEAQAEYFPGFFRLFEETTKHEVRGGPERSSALSPQFLYSIDIQADSAARLLSVSAITILVPGIPSRQPGP